MLLSVLFPFFFLAPVYICFLFPFSLVNNHPGQFFLIGLVFQEVTETKMQLLDNSEVWLSVGELKVHVFVLKVSGELS